MAEVLLRRHLEEAGAAVTVSSAGLLAGGRPATDHGRQAMASRGLDLSAHESRQLSRQIVGQADLIIGMAREHVREAALLDPGALARAFTLKELARLASAAGPRAPGESLGSWLERAGAGRRRESLQGAGHDDAYDVADPVGRSADHYERTAEELDRLLGLVVATAWPSTAVNAEERSA